VRGKAFNWVVGAEALCQVKGEEMGYSRVFIFFFAVCFFSCLLGLGREGIKEQGKARRARGQKGTRDGKNKGRPCRRRARGWVVLAAGRGGRRV
jgi:hypothetical protein